MRGTALIEKHRRPLLVLAAVLLATVIACQLVGGAPPMLGYVTSLALVVELWIVRLFSFGKPRFGATALEHVCCICVCLYYVLAAVVPAGVVVWIGSLACGDAATALYARSLAALAFLAYLGLGVLCKSLSNSIQKASK